jgi:hypothetical protein
MFVGPWPTSSTSLSLWWCWCVVLSRAVTDEIIANRRHFHMWVVARGGGGGGGKGVGGGRVHIRPPLAPL